VATTRKEIESGIQELRKLSSWFSGFQI